MGIGCRVWGTGSGTRVLHPIPFTLRAFSCTLLGLAAKEIFAQGDGKLGLSGGGFGAHETLALIAGLR
jgi:hypothetical protein